MYHFLVCRGRHFDTISGDDEQTDKQPLCKLVVHWLCIFLKPILIFNEL